MMQLLSQLNAYISKKLKKLSHGQQIEWSYLKLKLLYLLEWGWTKSSVSYFGNYFWEKTFSKKVSINWEINGFIYIPVYLRINVSFSPFSLSQTR